MAILTRSKITEEQIMFETVEGDIESYDGRYQDQSGPTASRFHEE